MTCTICGKRKCRRTRNGRTVAVRSLAAFKATLCAEARSVLNEYTYCEQQRLAYLLQRDGL